MKCINIFAAIGFAVAAVLPITPALAQLQHTFVSSNGSDLNNCSLAAPCRHLQAALVQTLAGGEIAILDTAGYNNATTVTITKSISIVNPGGYEAEIAPPSGGIGIVINAGPGDVVTLRGLTIDGGGVGQTGIQLNTGASLIVDNCIIRNLNGDGIDFFPTNPVYPNLTVSNTLVANNGLSAIWVQPRGPILAKVVFNRVEVNHNADNGIGIDGSKASSGGSIRATVSDSVAAGNGSSGFYAASIPAVSAVLMVVRSVTANNGYGLLTSDSNTANIDLAQSTVTGNTSGWLINTYGIIYSFGDNYIDGNGAPSGSLTIISKQ